MGIKSTLFKGSAQFVKELVGEEAIDISVKIGKEIYEQQKSMVKIPDLKDVHIDEAMRVLKDELHLVPTKAYANPNIAFADESDNEVMYSEPRFGSRVNPGSPIKVYYLNQEVIDKSKVLFNKAVSEFKVPIVVGLNVYEAREYLEKLGLRVADKLETSHHSFANKEDGQVTRLTYPNDKSVGSKLKTGDRVFLYYVNEEIILDSKALKEKSDQDKQEMIDNISKSAKDLTKGLSNGAVDVTKNLVNSLGNPFNKKKSSNEE
jgi:hypothetical protein